jgi:hypothetical protein
MLSFTTFVNAQTTSLSGTVTEEIGEVVMFATVTIKKGKAVIAETYTDFDGKYQFDSLGIDTYDVAVSYVGYQTKTIEDVVIFPDKDLILNIEISQGVEISCPGYFIYYPDLYDFGFNSQGTIFRAKEIEKSPIKN